MKHNAPGLASSVPLGLLDAARWMSCRICECRISETRRDLCIDIAIDVQEVDELRYRYLEAESPCRQGSLDTYDSEWHESLAGMTVLTSNTLLFPLLCEPITAIWGRSYGRSNQLIIYSESGVYIRCCCSRRSMRRHLEAMSIGSGQLAFAHAPFL